MTNAVLVKDEFKTPIIILFVNFYRFVFKCCLKFWFKNLVYSLLGLTPKFPLVASSFTSKTHNIRWTNLLILIWNFGLNVLTFYALGFLDPFSLLFISTHCYQANSIFTNFVGICVNYVHPLVYAIDSMYLLSAGHRIARLLDALSFRSQGFGSTRRQAIISFVIVFTVNNFLFWEFYKVAFTFRSSGDVGQEFRACPWWQEVLCVVAMYIVTVFNFVNCYILHYSQQCTYGSLKVLKIENCWCGCF